MKERRDRYMALELAMTAKKIVILSLTVYALCYYVVPCL
jgi:hypothetical protein